MKLKPSLRAAGTIIAMSLLQSLAQAENATSAPASQAVEPYPMSLNYALMGLAVLQLIVIVSMSSIMRTLGAPGKFWTEGRKRAGMMLLLTGVALHASAMPMKEAPFTTTHLFWWLVCTNIFLLLVIVVQMNLMRFLTKTVLNVPDPVEIIDPRAEPWDLRMWKKLGNRVPIEREQDILLDHDYDGIRELDNALPPWWLWLFYGSIAWSFMYLINVHVVNVWPHQQEEYKQEMAQAKADITAYQAQFKNLVNEENVTLLTDAASITAGNLEFHEYCVACHGPALEGKEGLGPNLTDAYWKHGGGIKNVFHTITYGVPEKGMISWKTQMKPLEIQNLASYILSMQGSNPPNAKAPEGDLWKEQAAPTDTTVAASDTTKLATTPP